MFLILGFMNDATVTLLYLTVYLPVPGLNFGMQVVFLSAVACGIQFPEQGSIRSGPPALGAWSLSH